MKDRIVAFLLFLGKLAITCAVGELNCMIAMQVLDTGWRCCGWIIMYILSTILTGRTYICVHAGILAYIGFGGYVDLGQTLWSEELNYYLIPILVSWKRFFILVNSYLCLRGLLHHIVVCLFDGCLYLTVYDAGSYYCCLPHFIWVHECLPHGCGHHLYLCKWV